MTASALDNSVPAGRTGVITNASAYGVLCAGTTATNPIQDVSPGTAGAVLISGGPAALPSFVSALSGTWTPTVVGSTGAGTATYTSQVGSYFRMGPIVFVSWFVAWNTGTGTGNLMIGGLPIAANAGAAITTLGTYQLASGTLPAANTIDLQCQILGGSSANSIFLSGSNSSGNGVQTPYSAAGSIIGTTWYWAA